MLWKILSTIGVPESLIGVLEKLYTDVTINLRGLCHPRKLSATNESRSPRRILGAWCKTARPTGGPQQTIRHTYIRTLKKLGFEQGEGLLAEWMPVARDRSAWARKVEYKLLLPPGSFTNLHETRTTNDYNIDKIGLDRRFNGKKTNYYYCTTNYYYVYK
jgi:hypothetical protein